MELKEFIANTITEIQKGVQLAIDQTENIKGAVNPVWGKQGMGRDNVQNINFDIAVTVSEKNGEQATGGIKVMGIGLDGKVNSSSENSYVSRIQFSIPIIPTGQVIFGSKEESA